MQMRRDAERVGEPLSRDDAYGVFSCPTNTSPAVPMIDFSRSLRRSNSSESVARRCSSCYALALCHTCGRVPEGFAGAAISFDTLTPIAWRAPMQLEVVRAQQRSPS
jgi:hypothetical protein